MAIDTKPMSLIIKPFSVIDVSVSMDESSLSICLVVLPPTLIHRSVRPDLSTFTLSNVFSADPLSVIFGVVLELDERSVIDWILSMVLLVFVIELS